MTNGNVHPLKNRMKVNIFFFLCSKCPINSYPACNVNKDEIRDMTQNLFAIKLFIIPHLSLQNHCALKTYLKIIYYFLCYLPLGKLQIICCTNIIYSNHNIRLFENQRICLDMESNVSWRKFISKSLHTCNLSNVHMLYNVLSSLRG